MPLERINISSTWTFPSLFLLCFIYVVVFSILDLNSEAGSSELPPKIAIVMVLTGDTKENNYQTAFDTIRCYAKIHNYEFVLAVDTDYNCPHKDKFFRRHCVVAKILPLYQAVLFLDADIGVVNPQRKIEDFLRRGIDIIFANRFYNWEIAAGYYLVRNTTFAVDLLNEFADYEYKLPNSFHGTDNGALHILLAEKLFPYASIETEMCRSAYNKSKNFNDLFTYEACIKAMMGVGTDFGKVRILKKGTGWARDGWLTSMMWHPEIDFMIHGWKSNQLKPTPNTPLKPKEMGTSQWYNPLNGTIDLAKCHPGNSTWSFDRRLLGDKEEILNSLKKFEEQIIIQQMKSYARMKEFL